MLKNFKSRVEQNLEVFTYRSLYEAVCLKGRLSSSKFPFLKSKFSSFILLLWCTAFMPSLFSTASPPFPSLSFSASSLRKLSGETRLPGCWLMAPKPPWLPQSDLRERWRRRPLPFIPLKSPSSLILLSGSLGISKLESCSSSCGSATQLISLCLRENSSSGNSSSS